jgi:hypothetical protein
MSETRMRELRRQVRSGLGVSRELAPNVDRVLYAARAVAEMVDIRSSRFKLYAFDRETGDYVTLTQALVRHREAKELAERQAARRAVEL